MRRTDQMELGLNAKYGAGGVALRRQKSAQRAQWWFQQMRRVVQAAVDWPSSPAARPEQVYIKLEPNLSQS